MEIVHNNQKKNEENVAFSVSYGSKPAETVLENMEKSLLNQMGNVFSIIHGGVSKKRRNNAFA